MSPRVSRTERPLSLVVLSERLNIAAILSLDSDFDVYRRFRRQPFQRVPLQP